MSWQDRLREAALTGATGQRIPFAYEDVEEVITARGTMHEFAGVNGGYGQRTGDGPRRFPIRAFFSGPDHDLQSRAFVATALSGVCSLEHPVYGTHDVVSLGEVSRRDDLKNEANQSVVELTLWSTLGAVYPDPGVDLPATLELSLGSFNTSAAGAFGALARVRSGVAKARLAASTTSALGQIRSALRSIASTSRTISGTFSSTDRLILGALDTLVGQPLSLARSLLDLVQSPGRAFTRVTSRLSAYRGLAESIIDRFGRLGSSTGGSVEEDVDSKVNDYYLGDLLATGSVAASALSCAQNTFATRREAIEAAEILLTQLQEIVEWREARGAELGEVDTGEAYQALQDLVALTAGYLVQVSFTLLPERSIVTDRARTIIDLAAELYGEVDEKLDYLIATNNLSGDEILEVPAGRKILYYV